MGDTDEHHYPHERPPKPTQVLLKVFRMLGLGTPGGKLPLIPPQNPSGMDSRPTSPGHHFSSAHSQHPFLLGEEEKRKSLLDCSLRNISLVANGIHSPGYHDTSCHTQAPRNSQKNSFQWVQNVAYTLRSVFIGQVPGTCSPSPHPAEPGPRDQLNTKRYQEGVYRNTPNFWLL